MQKSDENEKFTQKAYRYAVIEEPDGYTLHKLNPPSPSTPDIVGGKRGFISNAFNRQGLSL